MLAVDVGELAGWLAISLAGAFALLAVVLAARRGIVGRWPQRRTVRRLAAGVGAVAIAAPLAGILIYTQVVNDPEPAFDDDDLANLVGGSADATTGMLAALSWASATQTPPTSEPQGVCATSPTVSVPAEGKAREFDGTWTVADGSEVGYRVPEILAGVETEAVGRTSGIVGSLDVVAGAVVAACFEVEVATIESDQSLRDGQFSGRIMETAEFPTATFVLSAPLALEELPEVGGDAVTVEATGDLTMRGVTQEVTFELTAQAGQPDDTVIVGVLGAIPVVFADYGIADASGGPAQVGDEGTLEFLLAFEPA